MLSRRTSFLARKLFELSGLVPIGVFLIEHLYENAQVIGEGGAQRFDAVVVSLQTNRLVAFLEIAGLALPILYHAAYGLFVAQTARPNNGAYPFFRNWTYTLQRVTGVVLVLYIGYHVYHTRLYPLFHPELASWQHADGRALVSARYMRDYLNESLFGYPLVAIYALALACAVYHFVNGVWNLLIHWGITITPRAQRWSTVGCALVGVAMYAVGIKTIFAFARLS